MSDSLEARIRRLEERAFNSGAAPALVEILGKDNTRTPEQEVAYARAIQANQQIVTIFCVDARRQPETPQGPDVDTGDGPVRPA